MQLKLIYCGISAQSYPSIDTRRRRSLMPNPDRVTVNCNAEMTQNMVRKSRATTSHHLQTGCHPQATTTGVQNVATQHIRKDSHAQQKSTSARYVTNLGTSPVNVFKRSSTINRNIDSLKHIRYKLMSHTLIPTTTLQKVAQAKTHSVYKLKYKNRTKRPKNLPLLPT